MPTPPHPQVVAEVVRSGFVEGRHYGSVVALASDGSVEWAVGDVESPVLPRSCNKPLQAVAMLRCGLDLEGELLALAAASHSGEEFHVEGVSTILAAAGLDENALRTPPDLPLDERVRAEYLRGGGRPDPLVMNCSGKHAAMLATCVVNGWSTEDYLAADHPLQVAIRATHEELTGEPAAAVTVDGCGAPQLSTSLVGLARAYRRIALASDGSEQRVVDACRAHQEWVSGTTRSDLALVRAVPGLVAKIGAEGCYAAALPDGRVIALKVADGARRAAEVVVAAALLRAGVADLPGADATALQGMTRQPLTGGQGVVGDVRAAL